MQGFFLSALITITGCNVDPFSGFDLDFSESTLGANGRVEFAYAEGCGLNFLSGYLCHLNAPILAGGTAEIAYWSGTELSALGLRSSNRSVLRVDGVSGDQLDGYSLLAATGVSPGLADIELVDEGGAVFDRVEVEVAAAATLSAAIPPTRRVVLSGSRVSLPFLVQDDENFGLTGRGAIRFDVEGDLEPVSDYPPSVDRELYGTDHGVFLAGEIGEVTVTASLEELAVSETIEVVGEEAVAAIELSPDRQEAGEDGAVLSVSPLDAGGRFIHGARCAWRVEGPIVTSLELLRPDELAGGLFGGFELVRLRAEQPGTAQVTCAIGLASATAAVRFP
jgi:hypothetical protein